MARAVYYDVTNKMMRPLPDGVALDILSQDEQNYLEWDATGARLRVNANSCISNEAGNALRVSAVDGKIYSSGGGGGGGEPGPPGPPGPPGEDAASVGFLPLYFAGTDGGTLPQIHTMLSPDFEYIEVDEYQHDAQPTDLLILTMTHDYDSTTPFEVPLTGAKLSIPVELTGEAVVFTLTASTTGPVRCTLLLKLSA